MDASTSKEERPRESQWHRSGECPLLSGKIHILQYDADRPIGEALQHWTVDSNGGPFPAHSTSAARAESDIVTGLSRNPQRVILMELNPQAALDNNLVPSFDGLTSTLQSLSVPGDMFGWLRRFAEEQILGCSIDLLPRRKTIHLNSELLSDYTAFVFDWSRICGHDSRDGQCHYIGTGTCREGWQTSFEPHINGQVAAVLQASHCTVVLFSAHCLSAHARRRPINQVLSRKVMACTETMDSGELFRTQMSEALCRLIIQDEKDVIDQLEASLIEINNAIGDEARLREGTKQWQKLLGEWRVHFHTRRSFECRYTQLLDDAFPSDSARDEGELLGLSQPKKLLRQAHNEFEAEVRHVRELLESTFNAIMQTLSIIESQKAICEAEYVTRLTQLAFFFIPLSYVAGVCGMNIAEFGDGSLKAWIWAVTSVGVLAMTYLLFYYTDIEEYVISLRARIIKRRNRRRPANTKSEATAA